VRHDRQGLHCSEHVHGSPTKGEGSSLTNQGPRLKITNIVMVVMLNLC
jgi:hypothetical protein